MRTGKRKNPATKGLIPFLAMGVLVILLMSLSLHFHVLGTNYAEENPNFHLRISHFTQDYHQLEVNVYLDDVLHFENLSIPWGSSFDTLYPLALGEHKIEVQATKQDLHYQKLVQINSLYQETPLKLNYVVDLPEAELKEFYRIFLAWRKQRFSDNGEAELLNFALKEGAIKRMGEQIKLDSFEAYFREDTNSAEIIL